MQTQKQKKNKINYYLVKGTEAGGKRAGKRAGESLREWGISCPPLFKTKTESGTFLQSIRDLQFSMIMKKGESAKLYLIKTDMKPRELIDYFQKVPDWLSSESEDQRNDTREDLILVHSFDYVADPTKPTQSGLTMTYNRMREGLPILSDNSNFDNQETGETFYLSFPAINLLTEEGEEGHQ